MVAHVQNHIHLSDILGSAPENSPDSTWKVHARKPIPTIFINPRRGKTAKLFPNRLLDEDGIPVRILNWQYKIKVQGSTPEETQELLDELFSWQGKLIYLVDNMHPDDGEDHTDHVQQVLLTHVEPPEVDDWGLLRYFVDIVTESNAIE